MSPVVSPVVSPAVTSAVIPVTARAADQRVNQPTNQRTNQPTNQHSREPLSLKLPATSANLGPGFDALALALALYLEVDAAASEFFSIVAHGRNQDVCSQLQGNLLLDTYMATWARYAQGAATPLALTVRNGIPLGMGCGSSAASRLAGIALAVHFGGLRWDPGRMLDEAADLEHHPDNAAACCLGGFVASGYAHPLSGPATPAAQSAAPRQVEAVSIVPPRAWHAMLVLPELPLATTASRAVLPTDYPRQTIVDNLQNVALLTAAFATGDGRLLLAGTRDRIHQPYRGEVCPLLPRLLPLAGTPGILSVTLSGAGAGVLLLLENESAADEAKRQVGLCASSPKPIAIAELLVCALGLEPASLGPSPSRIE